MAQAKKATETVEIKFLSDYEVQDEMRGTEKATAFRKGERRKLPEASAHHFVGRGLAERI